MASTPLGGGGSKSNADSNTNSRVQIPGFLEPFIRQSTGTAGRALTGLESLLGLTGSASQVGPTPLSDVTGPGGTSVLVDPSRGAFVDASGNVIAPYQEGVVPGLVNGSNNPVEVRGGDVIGVGTTGVNELFSMPFVPGTPGQGVTTAPSADNLVAGFSPAQEVAQALGLERAIFGDLFSTAQNATQGIAANGFDTSALTSLEQLGVDPAVASLLASRAEGGNLAGTGSLSGLLGGAIPDTATTALESTAAGDFLFGGDGFNAAVDAAVRRATPGILSTFGSAGAGGATGGLAQEAIGTAAIDAFASQFANERRNQLGAADTLGRLGLADVGQQADIASTLGGLDLQDRGQQISAANILGNLGLAGDDLALRQALGETSAAQASAGAQLDASRLLPGLASADIDLLSRIGETQQAQAQNELDAPRNALLQLLTAALGGTPISSLLGQDTSFNGSQRDFGLNFLTDGG